MATPAELIQRLRAVAPPVKSYFWDDKKLDQFLILDPKAQQTVGDWLLPLIDNERRRGRPQKAQESAFKILAMVVANALVVAPEATTAVRYSRAHGAYQGKAPYSPTWLHSKALLGIVDGLVGADFLIAIIAPAGTHTSRQSTFRASAALIEGLAERGITVAQSEADASAPVLFLRDEKGHDIPYDTNDGDVVALAAPVRAYNSYLAGQVLGLVVSPEDRLDDTVNLTRRRLGRIFNNGSWDLGGRLYWGWWQDVRADLRAKITIDGEETVELDFQAFMARAAYHLLGKEYAGDPYDIPEIHTAALAEGLEWRDGVRDSIKAVFMWMLNGKSAKGLPIDLIDLLLPTGHTVTTVRAAIASYHPDLKDSFFTQMSLRVMRQDSDVCIGVLSDGVRDDIVVLPIHDSFIVARRHRDWLKDSMTLHYRELFGFSPVVS